MTKRTSLCRAATQSKLNLCIRSPDQLCEDTEGRARLERHCNGARSESRHRILTLMTVVGWTPIHRPPSMSYFCP